jgi:hypothetical protein
MKRDGRLSLNQTISNPSYTERDIFSTCLPNYREACVNVLWRGSLRAGQHSLMAELGSVRGH